MEGQRVSGAKRGLEKRSGVAKGCDLYPLGKKEDLGLSSEH